jgi:hypothetical protein
MAKHLTDEMVTIRRKLINAILLEAYELATTTDEKVNVARTLGKVNGCYPRRQDVKLSSRAR